MRNEKLLNNVGRKIVYICKECGFGYKEKEWAEKCEDWCRKHKSCNIEIIKHSVKGGADES